MLKRLIDSTKGIIDTQKRIGELRKYALEAARDGVFTDDELKEFEALQVQLGLTDDQIKSLRVEVYSATLKAAKSDARLNDDEIHSLERLVVHFSLDSEEAKHSYEELARYRLLYEIERGNLPISQVPGLISKRGEISYWCEPVQVFEEKIVKKYQVGQSSGFSVRIAKGISYRVGSSRGQTVTETGLVMVGKGDFAITTHRLVFLGASTSIEMPWSKVVNLQLYSDALAVFVGSRSKPLFIKPINHHNLEVIAATISQIVNKN